jgi:hypothetical protein
VTKSAILAVVGVVHKGGKLLSRALLASRCADLKAIGCPTAGAGLISLIYPGLSRRSGKQPLDG